MQSRQVDFGGTNVQRNILSVALSYRKDSGRRNDCPGGSGTLFSGHYNGDGIFQPLWGRGRSPVRHCQGKERYGKSAGRHE